MSNDSNKTHKDPMTLVTDWFRRTFSDPQVLALTLALLFIFAVILFMGDMLAPVLASVVIAYLLEGIVVWLERFRLPRLVSVFIVFISFVVFVTAIGVGAADPADAAGSEYAGKGAGKPHAPAGDVSRSDHARADHIDHLHDQD
jgi:hypothetical protein